MSKMFKSSFSKYLIAFTFIIVLSFFLMSAITSAMLYEHVDETKNAKLMNVSSTVSNDVAEHLKASGTISSSDFKEIGYILKFERDVIVIITLNQGGSEYVACYFNSVSADKQVPTNSHEAVDFSDFVPEEDAAGNAFLRRNEGTLSNIVTSSSRYYACDIDVDGTHYGYAIACVSNEKDDAIIITVRRAMLNGTLWVLLAAVIAVYFITERLVHPLKDMTKVVKSFAGGKFSERVVVTGRDEVAELGEAFNNMASSIENLEKMRSSFLASVSHDLRTPMTTISGFIDGITSGAIPPDKHDYYLGVISQEVKRLSRLVSQLLDVSRLESGDRKFNFADFDIAELSRIVLISFEQKIEDKRLEVSFETDEDSMTVHADKDAIHQVMYNLCHNAMKFSREGGRFEIKIKYTHDKKIEVSVFNEGQGISQSKIDMIFDRFYKTDESRGLDKSGVGLGLYISKTIIDAHGEKISVSSVENEYCEFKFTLKAGERLQRARFDGDADYSNGIEKPSERNE